MATQTTLSLKAKLAKSFAASFQFNSRNIEHCWYGFWNIVLTELVAPFVNIAVFPQYAVWFSGIGEGDEGLDPEEDSDDELDAFADPGELKEQQRQRQREQEELDAEVLQDSSSSSMITIPDGDAPSSFPDFALVHLNSVAMGHPFNRCYARREGYQIRHQCCVALVEVKRFVSRNLSEQQTRLAIRDSIVRASVDLGIQCYNYFHHCPMATSVIVIAACGPDWCFLQVSRSDVPFAHGDFPDATCWETMVWPRAVTYGSPASDARLSVLRRALEDKPSLGA